MQTAEFDPALWYFESQGNSSLLLRKGISPPEEISQWWKLMKVDESAPRVARDGSAGRGVVQRFQIPGAPQGERAVRRVGQRGGLFSQILGRNYFFLPGRTPRPFQELQILESLFSKGVLVVEPLAALISYSHGSVFYQSSLATRELPDWENLVISARGGRDLQLLLPLIESAGREARKTLQAGVFHPDLHAGNILTGPWHPESGVPGTSVRLLDFDNARIFSPSPERLQSVSLQLQERFERFCGKYGIYPSQFSAAFKKGLFEDSPGRAQAA